MARNLFTTKTVLPLIAPTFALALAIAPDVGEILKRRTDRGTAQDIDNYVNMAIKIGGLLGIGGAITGRYYATQDVYTPKGIPGRDLEDIPQEQGGFEPPD